MHVESWWFTITPYFEGSSTLVTLIISKRGLNEIVGTYIIKGRHSQYPHSIHTTIVPSFPWALWKSLNCSNGNSQIISLFNTKKGESSFPRISRANARGPANDLIYYT